MTTKIPATVITGFLGSGKTTMIRNLLMNAGGRKIALIINEFGDVGVDGETLKGCGQEACTEDDMIELANGCICCTVADDFVPTMNKLLGIAGIPVVAIMTVSGFGVALGMAGLQRAMGGRLNIDWPVISYGLGCGVLNNAAWALALLSIRHVPIALWAVITSTTPIWTYVFALALIFYRNIGDMQTMGMFVSHLSMIAGLLLV